MKWLAEDDYLTPIHDKEVCPYWIVLLCRNETFQGFNTFYHEDHESRMVSTFVLYD
jgi:hypothetical protein